ncbi:transcriptional activator acu-15 [Fusarium subglutinans]|uniref:Transcriptional activator acu-15 n=1 Tax=Gibberella subglutinans TaxID=42677 RepID=A0A8H5QFK8_GIBSU|nr:transcriptional activator acu-15 [Fusarium subglutinans]KAF5612951.1 transcriptional activator acu-15 [Fusarium subglutinans]
MEEMEIQQAIEADDFHGGGGRTVHSAPITSEYPGHVDVPLGHHAHSHPGHQNMPGNDGHGGTWRWRRRSSQRPGLVTHTGTGTDLVAPDHDPTGSPVIIPFSHAQFASPLAVRAHNHNHPHHHIHPQSLPNSPYTHPHALHHQILPSRQSLSHSHISDNSATVDGHFGTMEQIETQASDLRFLAQVPVLNPTSSPSLGPGSGAGRGGTPARTPGSAVGASTGAPIAYENHASPSSASVGDNSAHGANASNANKRKSADDGQGNGAKQARSKRNRGFLLQRATQDCTILAYRVLRVLGPMNESDEFKQVTSQLGRLQEEVGWLHQTVKALQSEPARYSSLGDRTMTHGHGTPAVAPSPSHSSASLNRQDSSKYGSFRGPTSMAFSLDVANNTINNMGYKGISDEENPHLNDGMGPTSTRPRDPLHEFDKDEMIRLCRLHEEEIGIMYPVLNIQTVISHAKNMATFLETLRQQSPRELVNDDKTLQLKIIMCCALVVEEHGHSDKAIRLFESMETVLNRKLMAEAADVATLPILALVAGYRFLSNDEVLAWRVMGHVARLCLELGIHQRTGLMRIQDEEERKNALVSFWSAYVLDRRWAFATGLPFVVQDEEIDSELPFPEEYPYLVAMITYSRIGAKVWRQVAHFGPVLARDLRSAELENVDQELLQWYEQIPEEVKVRNWDKEKHITSTPSYNLQRLRIWTYLRLNQMRIWLYTPVLHSATSIMAHPAQSERVVDIAKDTIRYLSHLNNTTNLYRRVQVFYHQFLTSAIAVVFLASVHAPVRFSASCREEFYMALELVKDLSAKSWASQRLWRTIRSLKDVAPRFGLNAEDDPQSTAALGMIGLARGHMEQQQPFRKPSIPGQQSQAATPDSMAQNGSRIQAEMSRMFEGYVGLNGFQYNDNEGQQGPNAEVSEASNGGMFGSDGTVFPQFKEMY